MGKVFTHMTMSLDGFIADPNDQVGELFDWYGAGDVTVPTPNEEISFQVDDASAEMLRELTGNTGALVSGRHLFDIANGWDDNHPAGAPVVDVERGVSLVPVLFGEGVPYFTKLDRGHQLLDDPIVVQGRRALHLRYPVRR
jgi:hypothetical protein